MTTRTMGPQEQPCDLLAERALLGAVLINPEALAGLPWVRAEHFYEHAHRWIFDAALAVADAGLTPDFVTVRDQLDQAGQLGEVGGAAYLAKLITDCPNSVHALSYARLLEGLWQRRELLAGATKLAEAAYAPAKHDPRAVLAEIERALTGRGGSTALAVADVANEVWEAICYPERMAARLVPTGLAEWDTALGGGLERQTLTVVMARPSMGKTALLVQIADYVSEHIGTVAVFSKEMTARQWLLRTACRRARVSPLALKQGMAGDDARGRVLQEVATLSERTTLVLDDSGTQTTDDVRAICDRLAQTGNLALIVADHLRLFADRADNENKRQGAISWAFKRMAKALDVPVLVAAQLNRGVEQGTEKKPDLKDLRDSGEIEENADNVTALYRAEYYRANPLDKLDNTAELINRKARDGERNARARFAFIAPYMSFEPLAKGS